MCWNHDKIGVKRKKIFIFDLKSNTFEIFKNGDLTMCLNARISDEMLFHFLRTKFPKLEDKNIQFWFKNRRAKFKRLNSLL